MHFGRIRNSTALLGVCGMLSVNCGVFENGNLIVLVDRVQNKYGSLFTIVSVKHGTSTFHSTKGPFVKQFE